MSDPTSLAQFSKLPITAEARVTQVMRASADRIFDAWLDPVMLGQWMFGPRVRDETVVRLEVDPRVGGSFSFVVLRDGTEIDHVGEYLELERPRCLAFTWAVRENLPETSRVRIELTPRGAECEVVLTHELAPAWADYRGEVEASWEKMLTALAKLLESNAAIGTRPNGGK